MLLWLLVLIIRFSNAQHDSQSSPIPGEQCKRACSDNDTKICHFKFHLEHYHVLGPACGTCGKRDGNIMDCIKKQCIPADGVEGGVMSVNRQIPGPPIHVCKNDILMVDVINSMDGTATTIHWHGLHQHDSPYMDGVPYVTQCPILYGNTFRYTFKTTQPGTQFYHSHSGHHKVNGLYGGLVVRQDTTNDPSANLYDYDLPSHLIIASDWMKANAEEFVPGLLSSPLMLTNLLINGKGRIFSTENGKPMTSVPLTIMKVQKGFRYRFRFVNSLSHVCPVVFEIEDHSMLIISSDSFNLKPVPVRSFVSTSGERYDFVLHANYTGDKDKFWMRLKAIGHCQQGKYNIQQFAILTYKNPSRSTKRKVSEFISPLPKFQDMLHHEENFVIKSLNHPNTTCGKDAENLCITDCESYTEHPETTDGKPDYQFYLGFNNDYKDVKTFFKENDFTPFTTPGRGEIYMASINNISMSLPPHSLLTQPEENKESSFCSSESRPASCTDKTCRCTHRLKVKKNSIVELIIVDEIDRVTSLNHPFHLHGTAFFVISMGQHPDKLPMTVAMARRMNTAKKLSRINKPSTAYPIKDTVSIPSKGYAVFRFKAYNPGYWLLHCHYDWHTAAGMQLVLQVGETEEMIKAPENFPKCGNFQPNVVEINSQD